MAYSSPLFQVLDQFWAQTSPKCITPSPVAVGFYYLILSDSCPHQRSHRAFYRAESLRQGLHLPIQTNPVTEQSVK